MFEEFCLPDGHVAASVKDVDDYLKRTGSARADDFSDDYLKNRRYFFEKAQDADLRSAFIFNYKKEIWK
ncbi:MAG: hypothetical protein J5896_04600 [Alphaproteobacteria bacterium]|nr:hypothetical protein [Alphaproteobacteria bacterium]